MWRITEEESFFLKKVPIKREVTHPQKRLQHLAGRYLLTALFPQFPLRQIEIADTRKPYLPDEAFHFSISHCRNFAAALVSKTERVGIDIEWPTEKVFAIAHKFLSEQEMSLLHQNRSTRQLLDHTTLFWSTKEAIFKWHGSGQVDFKKHIRIHQHTGSEEEGAVSCSFQKELPIPLTIHYRFLHGLALSWVTSN